MAAFVYTDAYVEINSTDISTDVKSVELSIDLSTEDATTMGSTWATNLPGVLSGSVTIEFVDDFANSAIDDILWALVIARAAVAFELRPTSDAVGTSNPSFSGNLIPASHAVGGSHGSAAMKSVTYPVTGTVTRAEA